MLTGYSRSTAMRAQEQVYLYTTRPSAMFLGLFILLHVPLSDS